MRIFLAFILAILPLRADIDLSDPAFLASLQAPAAPVDGFVFLTSGYKASANNTDATTDAVDTSGAHFIVIGANWYSPGGAASVSDSKGNTWTNVVHVEGAPPSATALWRSQNSPSVGSGHTFTISGGTIYPSITFAAFSGNAVSIDATNGATAVATSIQTESVTPSEDGCLIVTSISFYENNGMSIDLGFSTPIESARAPEALGGALSYLIQGTAGAVNPNWSWSGGNNNAGTAIAVFRR